MNLIQWKKTGFNSSLSELDLLQNEINKLFDNDFLKIAGLEEVRFLQLILLRMITISISIWIFQG